MLRSSCGLKMTLKRLGDACRGCKALVCLRPGIASGSSQLSTPLRILYMAPFDTDFPADCLEFCPNDQYQDIFVCGTYKLLDQASTSTSESESSADANSPQKRIGQCLALRLVPSTSDEISLYVVIYRPLRCTSSHHNQRKNPRVRSACSPGHEVEVVRRPSLICTQPLPTHNTRARCPGLHDTQPPTLAIADSEGSVTLHEWREVGHGSAPQLFTWERPLNRLSTARLLSDGRGPLCAPRHACALHRLVEPARGGP